MLLKLENGMIMQVYDSDNCLFEDDTNSCEGYNLFNADGSYNDGGELDFNSNTIGKEEDLFKKVIEMATDQNLSYEVVAYTSDCAYEDFEELLEEEFDAEDMQKLLAHIDNKDLRNLIQNKIEELR